MFFIASSLSKITNLPKNALGVNKKQQKISYNIYIKNFSVLCSLQKYSKDFGGTLRRVKLANYLNQKLVTLFNSRCNANSYITYICFNSLVSYEHYEFMNLSKWFIVTVTIETVAIKEYDKREV